LLAGKRELHDNLLAVKDYRPMTGEEMSEVLRQIGWPLGELCRRLSVREDTARGWLSNRRPIPPNVAQWLHQVRDGINTAPALPEGWRT
jgi:hypothetical protein